ncbi:interleukin-17C [Amia ocellicauda]|uniref:interleukin-17C n=1 Tax=Amia ocellicauda TaxID=2972642 RepID=UPI003463B08A
MEKITVLVVLSMLGLVGGTRCYTEGDKIKTRYQKIFKMPIYNKHLTVNAGKDLRCPDYNRIRPAEDYSSRSISPWRYRIDVDENRYPRKLAFAQCLCKGCIVGSNLTESNSHVSVTVTQTLMVLKKTACKGDKTPGSRKFSLKVEYISVPVACTCVLPKY